MTHPYLRLLCRTALALTATLLLSSPASALKPSHEADRLVLAAKEAIDNDDYSQAEEHLRAARQLGIKLPPDYDFFYGKLLRQQNDWTAARTHLEQYADSAGNTGENYREALSLITQIEKDRGGRTEPRPNSPEGTAEIRWADKQQQYVDDIQELYQTPDASQALVQHINSLLKFYAYGDERIIGGSRRGTPSRHRIHTSDRGEIVSFTKLGTAKEEPFRESRFAVYGVDPHVQHQCSRATDNCWITHPVTSERWLQILQNEEVAAELAKAFSQLIKRMQKVE